MAEQLVKIQGKENDPQNLVETNCVKGSHGLMAGIDRSHGLNALTAGMDGFLGWIDW